MGWEEDLLAARKRQAVYTDNFLHHLTEMVTVMINDEGNYLVPTLEDLDQHEQTLPSYIQNAWSELGAVEGEVRRARLKRDDAKGKARNDIKDVYTRKQEKLPAEHFVDAEVIRNPLVHHAEYALAEAEERLSVVKGTIKALECKQAFIPGLQGTRNRLIGG